jgi:hypothetical protein
MHARPVKRQLVEITFLDHCMNDGVNLAPIPCSVTGTLIGECKDAWYVATWLADGQTDQNMESFTILKKVVIKMHRLVKRGVPRVRPAKSKKAK